jgi:NADPH-dependent 2,4-dienoyl-CoA reductase/sulfur reductase-like enzyme
MPGAKKRNDEAPSVTPRPGIGRRAFLDATLGTTLAAVVAAQAADAIAAERRSGTATYAEHLRTPIVGRYQVVVAGGAPSGVIAAAAAARSGAQTLLVERYALATVWYDGDLASPATAWT